MGRPLNKRYFGEPTIEGKEIKVQFFNGTASVNGWIVKQLGSKRFRCTDGTLTEDCVLVNKASTAITTGEMSISVKDDAGTVEQVVKISGHKVTTGAGQVLPWNFDVSTTDGRAQVEEAGDDVSGTNEDDFEGDDV